MKKLFDDLYYMIPIGESVLFKKDIEKIKKLYTLPSNETYSIVSLGEFYEPRVTVKQLSDFFQDFCQKWNYSGIDVNMKTHSYYSKKFPTMITTITFRKKKPGFLSILTQEKENSLKNQIKEIKSLLSDEIKGLWRYTKEAEFGDVKKSFSELENEIFETFGCYLILFHKSASNNLSKS